MHNLEKYTHNFFIKEFARALLSQFWISIQTVLLPKASITCINSRLLNTKLWDESRKYTSDWQTGNTLLHNHPTRRFCVHNK